MDNNNPYQQLAERLDALPEGFPATEDGIELKLLAKLYTPEEAALAAQLRLTPEMPRQIAKRIGEDPKTLRSRLKEMARKGLITIERNERGSGYRLLPFVVGIYEMQVATIDAELAELFEAYYHQAFGTVATLKPSFHRVVPVEQSVQVDMEVRPFESAAEIVDKAKAWGVLDCICRKQQALIGNPCEHPLDVCMIMSETPGTFDNQPNVKALTRDEAMATLRRAAEAGLVHSVSNNQKDTWYICNCCTCACGVLRGMVDLGMANVIARSAFVSQVDEELCIACGACVEKCQFGALSVDEVARVDDIRCVGCGVCVLACPQEAISLIRRPEDEILQPPQDEDAWREQRATARHVDLDKVL